MVDLVDLSIVFCERLPVNIRNFGSHTTMEPPVACPKNLWQMVGFKWQGEDKKWVCLKMLCTPLYPMVLLIIIPMKNGYFIGKINPTFSDKPKWLLLIFLKQKNCEDCEDLHVSNQNEKRKCSRNLSPSCLQSHRSQVVAPKSWDSLQNVPGPHCPSQLSREWKRISWLIFQILNSFKTIINHHLQLEHLPYLPHLSQGFFAQNAPGHFS